MPNVIKYSLSAQSKALKRGNFFIGTGDDPKGTTVNSEYWNGITPPNGGYTIYLNKASQGPSIYVAANDAELISLTNRIAGTGYTTINECFTYFSTQTDKMVLNKSYEQIVTNGLVFSLNSGFIPSYPRSGNTWYDIVGSNNGTLVNSPTFTNDSMVFDGVNDYINLSTNIQSGYTQATYEFVCRSTSLPSPGDYKQLYIQESSTWIGLYNVGSGAFFGIDLNNGSGWCDNNGGSNTNARTTTTIEVNKYYHVVYSWDGTNVRVYLNGVLHNTASTLQAVNGRQNVTTLGPGSSHRNIGSRYSGAGNNWIGNMDVVKFYNRALSASEIVQNYYQGSIVTSGLIMLLDAGNSVSYPGTGTSWIDLTLTGNNGTLVNGTTFNSGNGGNILFDGSNDYVSCGNFSLSYITVSTWVYRTSSTTNQGICRKNNGWAVSQYNGTLQVAPGTNWRFFNTGYTIPLNQWINIVYTYSGTTQRVYINGNSIWSLAQSGALPTNGNGVNVGFDDNGWYWGGNISLTAIYNRELSESEVKQNYHAQASRFV